MTNPKLRVIGRTAIDVDAILGFLGEQGTDWRQDIQATPPESLVEFSGRVCYMSFGERQSPRSNPEYIANLVRQGHESVLEHVSWTFILAGVSRAFTHQFVRHRVGFSYSQLSQQYVDHEDIKFVEPFDLSAYPEAAKYWRRAIESIREAYANITEQLQERGPKEVFGSNKEFSRFVRSAARSILPNATETTLVFTANARALRLFLKLRGETSGDVEMRRVSTELLRILQQEAPALFADFHIETLEDESPIVRMTPLP